MVSHRESGNHCVTTAAMLNVPSSFSRTLLKAKQLLYNGVRIVALLLCWAFKHVSLGIPDIMHQELMSSEWHFFSGDISCAIFAFSVSYSEMLLLHDVLGSL